MLKFIFRRLISALTTVYFVITIVFFLVKLTPGKPFASEKMSVEAIQELERAYGFDRSLFVQYVDYLRHLIFYNDLGLSTRHLYSSVNDMIFPKDDDSSFYLSMKFGGVVILIVTILGILLGIVAALHPNGITDKCINVFTVLGITLPTIVTAPLLVLFFAVILGLFPTGGWAMSFKNLFLPVVALSIPNICYIAQIQRDSFINVLTMPFIKTARAMGIPKSWIIFKHAIKPSLIPTMSYLGPTAASIFSGSVVIEKVFSFPGIGTHTVNAATNRDYSMILALVIIYSIVLIICNTIIDIFYCYLDPKVKIS